MSILRSAARNISIVVGARFITWLASFAFTIFLARDLGAEAFGQLSLALAYVAFFTIFVDFGLSRHLSRIVAQRKPLKIRWFLHDTVAGGSTDGVIECRWCAAISPDLRRWCAPRRCAPRGFAPGRSASGPAARRPAARGGPVQSCIA